jgi:ribosomal protein S18 acetylase RimI-like enzyme
LAGDDLRIICRGGTEVGMFTVERHPDSLHIEDIVLLPAFQGHGIGTQLISGVCARADDLEVPITLEVLKVSRAWSLYERWGFRIVEETDTHYGMERSPDACGR